MKKSKKLLSALLAGLMAVSSMSPVFAAGDGKAAAQQAQAAAAAVEAKVESLQESIAEIGESDAYKAAKEALTALKADSTNIATKVPTDAAKLEAYNKKLALYETAVNACKALTEAEKDAMDIDLMLWFLREVVNRESFLDGGTGAANKMKVTKNLSAYVGPHAARDAAVALVAPLHEGKPKISTSSKFTDEKEQQALEAYINAFKAAPELVRMYADGLYISGTSVYFYYVYADGSYNAKRGTRAADLAKMIGLCYTAQNPCETVLPEKPNKNNYEGGVANTEYLAAIKAYCEADAAIQNYLSANCMKGIAEVASYATELKAGAAPQVIEQMRLACIAFNETKDSTQPEAAVAAYDKLNENELSAIQDVFDGIQAFRYVVTNASNGYSTSYVSVMNLYKQCKDYADYAKVLEFETYIAGIKFDEVNNDVVAESAKRYNALPSSLKPQISGEAMEKYTMIQNMYDPIKPLVPSRDMFEDEIAAYQPTYVWELKVPGMRPLLSANIAATDALLASLLKTALAYNANGSLKGVAKYSFFSNQNMSLLLKLFGVLGPLVEGIAIVGSGAAAKMRPSGFVAMIPEEKFTGAREKIAALAAENDTYDAYDAITFANGDWGFQDGDKEGFRDALITLFRPLGGLISMVFTMENKTNAKGDYIYGAYERIIPIFESLGLKGVISSEEFTARYTQAKENDKENGASDTTFSALLTPIVNLVEDLMKHPLNTILDLLPRAARAISSGSLNDQVHALLDEMSSLVSGMLGDLNIDLTADGINAMIAGQTISFDIGDFATATITLKAIDWAKLAGCGSLKAVISASAANAYRLDIQNGRPETYITVSKYLLKAVFSTKIEGKTQTVDLLALA